MFSSPWGSRQKRKAAGPVSIGVPVQRRATARSSAGSEGVTWTGEWQPAERRRGDRRVDNVPFLFCPDCREGLQHDAALSWSLPGTYTVDAGYCRSCSRRFLRNRETGEYDELSW